MKGPDWTDMQAIAKEMDDAATKLEMMAPGVGFARSICEYSGDRAKRALSLAVVPFLDKGDSATAAEHRARASTMYGDAMKALQKELREAETTKALWNAKNAQFDAARSRFSFQSKLVQA